MESSVWLTKPKLPRSTGFCPGRVPIDSYICLRANKRKTFGSIPLSMFTHGLLGGLGVFKNPTGIS